MENSLEDKATTNFPDSKSQHSMAISLKRIADALEKLTKPMVVPKMTLEQYEQWEKANKSAGFIVMNEPDPTNFGR